MDLQKLYDNIVLRDILEYTLPGSVVVMGVALIIDTTLSALGMNYSLLANLGGISAWEILALLAIAYMTGHLLTAFDIVFCRRDEGRQTAEVFKNNEWLKERVVEVLAEYTHTSPSYIGACLIDSSQATTLREISRFIIHKSQQELYREFVNRHSVLSRLYKSSAYALIFLLFSLLISACIGWGRLSVVLSPHLSLSVSVSILFVVAIGGTIMLLLKRARKTRSTMMKHSFQILYADYVLSRYVLRAP